MHVNVILKFEDSSDFDCKMSGIQLWGYIERIHNLQNTPEIEGLRYCLAALFGRYCLDTVLSVPAVQNTNWLEISLDVEV